MTTKHTHTPGPWVAEDVGAGDWEVNSARNDFHIASPSSHRPNVEANARLIAAAPDLLAAAEDLLLWANISDESRDAPLRDKVRTAIAKARGE